MNYNNIIAGLKQSILQVYSDSFTSGKLLLFAWLHACIDQERRCVHAVCTKIILMPNFTLSLLGCFQFPFPILQECRRHLVFQNSWRSIVHIPMEGSLILSEYMEWTDPCCWIIRMQSPLPSFMLALDLTSRLEVPGDPWPANTIIYQVCGMRASN